MATYLYHFYLNSLTWPIILLDIIHCNLFYFDILEFLRPSTEYYYHLVHFVYPLTW